MAAGAQTRFRIFAYGSNMLCARLKARCPSASAVRVARLPGHALRWHKHSKDGSGKCDAVRVSGGHAVLGVVYKINANEKRALDQAEGLGQGCDQKDAKVLLHGDAVTVSIYVATKTDPELKPYTWYKALVVAGAQEHDLPVPYIAMLEAVEASQDPDRTRHDSNMRIVRAAGHMDGAQA